MNNIFIIAITVLIMIVIGYNNIVKGQLKYLKNGGTLLCGEGNFTESIALKNIKFLDNGSSVLSTKNHKWLLADCSKIVEEKKKDFE